MAGFIKIPSSAAFRILITVTRHKCKTILLNKPYISKIETLEAELIGPGWIAQLARAPP